MASWSYDNSLTDIQNCILEQIANHMGNHVLMGNILNISYEEYEVLTSKLRFISQVEECEKYCIAIIAAWVAACKHGREKQFYSELKQIKKRLPQHYHTYIMEAFTSTFYNYQIDTMGIEFKSSADIRKAIIMHND